MDEKLKVTAATIARTIILTLALINQLLTISGHAVIKLDDATITQLVSYAITVAAAIWGWWKNNSFTQPALKGDVVMETERALQAQDEEAKG